MKMLKTKRYLLLIAVVCVLGVLTARYIQVNQDYRVREGDISADWKTKIEQAESEPETSVETEGGQNNTIKINLNTASKERLMDIPGVGEKRAEDIIQYRESVGKFTKIEELKNIKGLGGKTFEKLKDHVEV